MLKKIIREPLVHFLVLGGLLFSAWGLFPSENPGGITTVGTAGSYGASGNENSASGNEIVVDQARLDHLVTLWKAQWKHEPSAQDMKAIIDRYLRQEVFYREALAMGLDKDDDIIRNRLSQKMEAVASDLSTLMEPPTDDQLRKFHASRPDLFTLPPAYAFRQVLYLPAEARGDTLKTELELLRAGESVPKDRLNKLSLPLDWPLTPAPELANAFGGNFAKALATLPEGEWAGPVRSGLGFHLVKVSEAKSGGLAPFDEIRDFVERQYEYYSVLDAQQKMFTELRDKYDIKFTARGVPEAVIKSYSRP